MKKFITAAAVLLTVAATAQTKKQQDVEAIKGMCGCHAVKFDYAETFASDTSYELHDQYHTSAPAEWVFVAEESEDKIVLQHLLVIQDSIIIKHWRQDWTYQETNIHEFYKDRTWKHKEFKADEVTGQWAQEVYQVDDSPRYSGLATWVHVDGKHYWESTVDAPLPRREYTKRSDYNVMQRTNKQILTDYGWLHEQDNLKVLRDGGKDVVIVQERGLNAYHKTDKSKCQAAIEWWNKNEAFWAIVRTEWDKVFDEKKDLTLESKVDNKLMWSYLFELGDEMAMKSKENPKKVAKEVREIILKFQKDTSMTSTSNSTKSN